MNLGKKIGFLILFVFMFTMSLSVGFCAQAPSSEKIKIMCYGDSNTWGWIPVESGATTRYDSNTRWTGVLQAQLGSRYQIIEEGLNGRTAGVDDYQNGLVDPLVKDMNLNGRPTLLPILKSQLPLDVVVVMLGTNDVKTHLKQSPEQIAQSVKNLVMIIKQSNGNKEAEWLNYKVPKILLVSPAPVKEGASQGLNELFTGSDKPSGQLAVLYEKVAAETGVEFFDAATLIPAADGLDGIHLTPASHKKLGLALADKIRSIAK